MLRAIRAVTSAEAIFSPSIAARMADFFAASRRVIPEEVFPDLTDREREVLDLIARCKSNAEIAHALTISVKTVRVHVSSIFSKLQVADSAQAVIPARAAGQDRRLPPTDCSGHALPLLHAREQQTARTLRQGRPFAKLPKASLRTRTTGACLPGSFLGRGIRIPWNRD